MKKDNKKILLIMPNFFDTQKEMINVLESKGYDVFLYSDRPSGNTIIKVLIRLNRHFVYFLTKRYIKKIVKETNGFDFYRIIIIDGQSFSYSHLNYLFNNVKSEKKVYYIWDPLSRFKYTKKILSLFNETLTYDFYDYKTGIFDYFLPLYISKGFEQDKNKKEYKYDMCFIGTTRPAKYEHVIKLRSAASENNLTFFEYLYLPTKAMFYYFKLTNKHFKKAKIKEFNFRPIPASKINEAYNNSRFMVDVGNTNEGGLSLRVFDSVANQKKLILTNRTIINYDFYFKNNFYIFEGKFDLSDDFFNTKLERSDEILDKYRIDNWIEFLINPETIGSFLRKIE